jgi:hypothetical protein
MLLTPQGCPSSPMTWLRSGRPGKKRPDEEAGSFVLEIRCPDDSTIARPFKLIQAEVISSEIECRVLWKSRRLRNALP